MRREALVEQFAATAFDLAELARELAPDATAAGWEEALGRRAPISNAWVR